MERLVVVGASVAGLRAVEAARRGGYNGRITLVGAEDHLPYDRPSLSKSFLEAAGPVRPRPLRGERELCEELGVELMLGAQADALDTTAKEVAVAGEPVPYDALVIATGAAPRPLPGAHRVEGVHQLRTVEDALAVRAALDAGARTVVIGAGFIGSEVASAARKRGLPVTVVEADELPLTRSVGPEVGAVCAELHREAGTDLRLNTRVSEVESRHGRVSGVRLSCGTVLPAELVVLGTGVAPATGWLAGSGVSLHPRDGGIVCTATLSAEGASGVYAAGDVAHVPNAVFHGELMRTEHWMNATEQGAAAGSAAVGARSPAGGMSVPYFWSDWYGRRIQFAGTPHADEVAVVGASGPGFTALYRRGDRLVGALTVERRRQVHTFRKLIMQRAGWAEASALAEEAATPA